MTDREKHTPTPGEEGRAMNEAREFAHKMALKCLRSGTFHFGLAAEMIEARDRAIRVAVLEEAAIECGRMHMHVNVGPPPRCEYLGFDHEGATAAILALATPADRDALREHDAKIAGDALCKAVDHLYYPEIDTCGCSLCEFRRKHDAKLLEPFERMASIWTYRAASQNCGCLECATIRLCATELEAALKAAKETR